MSMEQHAMQVGLCVRVRICVDRRWYSVLVSAQRFMREVAMLENCIGSGHFPRRMCSLVIIQDLDVP